MITVSNGITNLSVFNSDSLKFSPYADVSAHSFLPKCPHIGNTLYMTNIDKHVNTFFNRIDMDNGDIIDSTRLGISDLLIGKYNNLYGKCIQRNHPTGNEAICQIIQNTVVVRYNFTTDVIFPVFGYFKEIDAYIVSVAYLRKRSDEILIIRNWTLNNTFIIPGFNQFYSFSLLKNNQVYFFMCNRTELETGLYTLDMSTGTIKRFLTFGNSMIISTETDIRELKIYAIFYEDAYFWIEIDLRMNSYTKREIPRMYYMCIISS